MFNITGAAAGAANLFKEFNIPDWNETIDINNKKGKVIRESSVANSIFLKLSLKPGAKTVITHGIANSTNNTKSPTKKQSADIALAAKRMACFLSSHTSFCDNIGTKAVVKAPSAKSERNKFGSLNATKKASEANPAPRKLARIISRKNPVIRERRVKPPKVAIDLNKFIFCHRFVHDINLMLRDYII